MLCSALLCWAVFGCGAVLCGAMLGCALLCFVVLRFGLLSVLALNRLSAKAAVSLYSVVHVRSLGWLCCGGKGPGTRMIFCPS